MKLIEIMLLSAALSIDALSIGASCGFSGIKTPLRAKCIICGVSVLITGIAVAAGKLLCGIIPETVCKVIGAFLLGGLGIYMMISSLREKKTEKKDTANVINVSARILSDPAECDRDSSSSIDNSEAFFMGVALSADSFAGGISAGVFGETAVFVPIMCGIFQMIFLCAGELIAKRVRRFSKVNQKYFSVISGLILVLTALLRMIVS